jgi:hypothetical protein
MMSGSCSMSGHSMEALSPYTSMLSRYWRAVSKRLRMMRAFTSVPLNLMCAVSTAKGRAVALLQFFADGAGAKAAHIFGRFADQAGHRADAVGGIPHRRQAGPVVRPAVHVLLMGGLHELELAEFALIELLFMKRYSRA